MTILSLLQRFIEEIRMKIILRTRIVTPDLVFLLLIAAAFRMIFWLSSSLSASRSRNGFGGDQERSQKRIQNEIDKIHIRMMFLQENSEKKLCVNI